jgi:flagellar hook-basal body complex protein FliE
VIPIGPPLPPAPLTLPLGLRGTQASQGFKGNAVEGPANANSQFCKLIFGKLDEVNTMQTDADGMVHEMLTGGDVNQAEVLTAVQKADLAFRMMLQVRNKLIEAYRELQQIQI